MRPAYRSRTFGSRSVRMAVAASCLAVAATVLSGRLSSAPRPSPQDSPDSREGVPRFGHVFMIIGENTTYDHITPTNMPYLMGTLLPRSAWFTEYYGATHWSQANYVALVTGQFTRCEQQDYGIACHQDVENLFHQLDLARLTWKTWLEAGSARCDTGSGGTCTSDTPCPLTGFYTTGNPAILFDNIEGPDGVWSATNPSEECLQNDIPAGDETDPMGFFNQALATGDVANFNLILPNGCEDGEGNCAPTNNRYTQFDDFLAREVPLIEASPAYGSDGAIFILYDEDERAGGLAKKNGLAQGGHVPGALLSPLVVPGLYDETVLHYSVLRTIEDGFGITDYLGSANDVTPITTVWP
jgi:phosphoesterase family protein